MKERVCALVIKLFSPNIKHHGGSNNSGRRNTITNTVTGSSSSSGSNNSSVMMMGVTGANSPTSNHRGDDRPHYAITVRLLRLVSILVRKYHKLLVCISYGYSKFMINKFIRFLTIFFFYFNQVSKLIKYSQKTSTSVKFIID